MPYLKLSCLLFFATFLAACDDHSHHEPVIERPTIYSWEVVDSYGHSNVGYSHNGHGDYSRSLLVDHTIDRGYFELFWDVESYDDYSATIYINDYPGLVGAYQLDSTYCGHGLSCDEEGFAYCEYYSGSRDEISCSASNHAKPFIDVTNLFTYHPSELYLILEACNSHSGYCTSETQKVAFD